MPSRHAVSSLPALLLLWLALPTQLQAQPAACLAAANLVNTPDFEASPRPDESAELLALWYSESLVADGDLYERLHYDLEQAALQLPELDLWPVHRGLKIPTIVVARFQNS